MPTGVYPRKSVIERFWENVSKDAECWNWIGYKNRYGYGETYADGRKCMASRLSYRLFVNDPGGLFVLHRCDNPSCVNPAHLFLGTQTENLADMRQKGRHVRGEMMKTAKLTEKSVREIRMSLDSHKEIATKYGIHEDHVSRIKRRVRWAHVASLLIGLLSLTVMAGAQSPVPAAQTPKQSPTAQKSPSTPPAPLPGPPIATPELTTLEKLALKSVGEEFQAFQRDFQALQQEVERNHPGFQLNSNGQLEPKASPK